MEIYRQGANRKTGWAVVKAKKPVIIFVEADKKFGPVVTLEIRRTNDPDRSGEYDHQVRLPLTDIAAILEALANRGISGFGDEVATELAPAVRALNRLMAHASGISVVSKT